MRISHYKNFNWDFYRDLVDKSVSKKYFLDYKLTEDNAKKFDAFYKSNNSKVIYIPISKNASTSVKKSLKFSPVYQVPKINCLFDLEIPEKYKFDYKIIVIIRNPNSRWISGFNEFLSDLNISLPNKLGRVEVMKELKNKKFIFDGHTLPQFSFIDYCFQPSDIDFDIELVKLDDNLDSKISNIIGDEVKITKNNTVIKDGLKLINYEYCKKILEDYCLKDPTFIELYKQDWDLYNHSK